MRQYGLHLTPTRIYFVDYPSLSKAAQSKLSDDLREAFRLQGFEIQVRGYYNPATTQKERRTPRIQFQCKNKQCSFSFQLNGDTDSCMWYMDRNKGRFTHTHDPVVVAKEEKISRTSSLRDPPASIMADRKIPSLPLISETSQSAIPPQPPPRTSLVPPPSSTGSGMISAESARPHSTSSVSTFSHSRFSMSVGPLSFPTTSSMSSMSRSDDETLATFFSSINLSATGRSSTSHDQRKLSRRENRSSRDDDDTDTRNYSSEIPSVGDVKVWNGGVYVGDMKENKAHGQGECRWETGCHYNGEWRDGKRHGRGVCVSANGDRYDGEWKHDEICGRGVFKWANEDEYNGEIKGGMLHGSGIMTDAKGNRYNGEFCNGRWHGQGVYKSGDEEYYGEWIDGKKHGRGIMTYADGSRYNGEFEYGDRHGRGEYKLANGDEYNGDWVSDRKHGWGLYRKANGDQYNGEWKEDETHGWGVFRVDGDGF